MSAEATIGDLQGQAGMSFGLAPEISDFQQAVHQFATQRLRPHYQSDDRTGKLRRDAVRELAELGLLGMRISEAYGGQDADCVTAGVAFETVARSDFNMGYVLNNAALVGDVLSRHGTEEQHSRFLPAIATGEHLPCICLTEPDHGSDAANLTVRAERVDGGWRLFGEKTSVTLGMDGDTALVLARTTGVGARGVSAFYVELDDDYVERAEFDDLGNRAIGRSSLHFDGLPLPEDSLIGKEGDGFIGVMQGFDYARALIAMICLGGARASLDEAAEYVKQRQAFGQALGRFQGVAFPLVECETQIRAARLLSLEALWRKDRGLPHTAEANMAKWWAPRVAVEVAHQALLLHGHAGYSTDLPLGQRMRDIIGLEIGDGTAQIAKLVVARQLLGRDFAP